MGIIQLRKSFKFYIAIMLFKPNVTQYIMDSDQHFLIIWFTKVTSNHVRTIVSSLSTLIWRNSAVSSSHVFLSGMSHVCFHINKILFYETIKAANI